MLLHPALNSGFVDQANATLFTSVLFIDDDPQDFQFWSNALRRADSFFLTLRASSGSAGIDLCQSKPVDCVVLGLELSDYGFEVLRALIPDPEKPKLPLVVLTHQGDPYLHARAVSFGAQACLVKHRTTPSQLTQAIRTAISSVKSIAQRLNAHDRRPLRYDGCLVSRDKDLAF
jgi:DNA-binding NarL/FixJ family response regulator